MKVDEAIKILNAIFHIIPKEYYNEETEGAIDMAIKSLEAWDKLEDDLEKAHIGEASYDSGIEYALYRVNKYIKEMEAEDEK